MDSKWLERIRRIERRTIAIVMIAVPIVQTVLDDLSITFGLAVGGCLELLNFYILRRLIEKILDGTSPEKTALISVALAFKFVALGLGLFLALRYLPVNALALIAGVSVVILSIVLEAFLPEKGNH